MISNAKRLRMVMTNEAGALPRGLGSLSLRGCLMQHRKAKLGRFARTVVRR